MFIHVAIADDFSDLLQDLAIQTACLGMYSTAQTGVLVTSRYDDPLDYYDPPLMANRFANMSGNKTRIDTFYGVCFDYAQFAWDDIKNYQKIYNDAGMKDQQWYIAVANAGDPYTIILYDPVPKERATIISNGVYLKENSRYKVQTHDKAEGHAWLWVQHENGVWYWIDPTWTDNTGFPWWGIVKDGKEMQFFPDPKFCIVSNYPQPPKPSEENTGTRNPDSTYAVSNVPIYEVPFFYGGYNYAMDLPIGVTIATHCAYFSVNLGASTEWTVGLAFPTLYSSLFLPIGLGGNHPVFDDNGKNKFVMEIGLQYILFKLLYFSATYRLIDFEESRFTLGAGIALY